MFTSTDISGWASCGALSYETRTLYQVPLYCTVVMERNQTSQCATVTNVAHRLSMLGDPRRWDHLVRKPLAVGDCALTSKEATELLQAVGVPSTLIDGTFDIFARRKYHSNCWSRAIGEVPERRADALELFAGLALTCRATVEEKLSTIFSLFDLGETGALVEEDLGALISSCASFLCRLGLSAPISNDEASFVAGSVFGRTKEFANTNSVRQAEEIGLPEFLSWARQAKLPVGALELLSLPHRFSGALGLVSDKLSMLRERYAARRSAGDRSRPPCQPQWKTECAPLKRVSRPPRGNGVRGHNLSFILPPVLHRVCSNNAKVVLEASPSGAPTAAGVIWHAVVTIEERGESRFVVVDSQSIILRGGVPTVLLFSELKAETNHRVQLSWNVCKPKGKMARDRSNVRSVCKRGRRTLRFTTLSESSTAVNDSPRQMGTSPTLFPGWKSGTPARRSIHVITANSQVSNSGPFRASPPPSTSMDAKGRNRLVMDRSISVVISHQQPTSLDSTDDHLDVKPWWGIPRPSDGTKSSGIDPSATSSQQNDRPLTRATDPDLTTVSAPSMTPTNGEIPDVPTPGYVHSRCWGAGGSGSDGIDVMVHLCPSWRAIGAIRRCFHILNESQFESSVVREDGRGIVTLEATKAVRSLIHKTCRFQGCSPSDPDPGRKTCAHIILGAPNPWLGLGEVRFT